MNRVVSLVVLYLCLGSVLFAQQVADPNFDTKVAKPAFPAKHPKVLFDEAHNNFHTATGRYKPFADLITNDGYQVTPNLQKFSRQILKGYDLLVISNALGAPTMNAPEAGNPAFTAEESDAVRDWVKDGGALLLIADHAPMGAANQILGERFGVNMSKMFTIDTFTDQSLKGPADSESFLKLADTAVDAMQGTNANPVSAAGRSQGLALKFGKGRVVVLGEAAMLSAQLAGPNRMQFGMNRPGIDNRQLALNIVHWLSGLLK